MERIKRYCKECNEELHGRRDKRFCTDYCRATYYNRTNATTTNLMRRVNYKICKNRRILARFNPTGKTRVSRQKLIESGLNFDYFTHIHKTHSGQLFYFCYDQGYREMGNNYVKILARKVTND